MLGGGEGDLALWTEWQGDRIRGWAPDGKGVRTLVEAAPSRTCWVRPSSTKIVGVAETKSCDEYGSGSLRIWHAPRSYDLVPSVTVAGPFESNDVVAPVGLRTRGDYAAVLAWEPPPATAVGHLVVVQLSTGKAWRVSAEAGYVLHWRCWALDDTWLYYGEKLSNESDSLKLRRMRRILLTNLDTWGKPL
jgi:hypothetical protein